MLNFTPYIDVLPNILSAFVIGLIFTPILRFIGLRYGFSTKPKSETNPNERGYITKHHTKTTSRLGEFAMVIPLFLLMWKGLDLNTQVLGIVLSISMVAILGAFDSKYDLSEFVKLYILFFAALILILTGTIININSIVDIGNIGRIVINPITQEKWYLFNYIISIVLTLGWIYVISTALSYVGGIDGLSEGTSAIAIMILTLIGIRNGDILTIVIGSLCLGGLLGLLPYNFHPAVIFSEHLIYGFIIAILAIVSKGKITTSVLLLTVPILDFAYVSYYRLKRYFKENKGISIRKMLHYLGTTDRNHLHHRLMNLGFGHVKISLIQYLMYGILGLVAIAVSGLYLTFAIVSSVVIIVLIFYYINWKLSYAKKQ